MPVSPVMSTVESLRATFDTRASTGCSAGEVPTISSNIDAVPLRAVSPYSDLRVRIEAAEVEFSMHLA